MCTLSCLSHARLFLTLQTVARQAPLTMGFCKQEYWCGLPWPPPETVVDRVNFKLYFKLPPLPTSSSPLNPRLNRIASPLTRSMAVAALRPLPISPFDKERAGSRLTVLERSLARIQKHTPSYLRDGHLVLVPGPSASVSSDKRDWDFPFIVATQSLLLKYP